MPHNDATNLQKKQKWWGENKQATDQVELKMEQNFFHNGVALKNVVHMHFQSSTPKRGHQNVHARIEHIKFKK